MKTCIIIAGPTAVGKTATAIELARHFNTHVISADSRQCYKELDIGVAKPSGTELALVHHYFINSHSITENLSAADFEAYALDAIDRVFKDHDVAVMSGGTGLYIKAFAEGLDEIPATDPNLRASIINSYEQLGVPWLQEQLQTFDPLYVTSGEMQNPQRMMRALEVKLSTGRSILDFFSAHKKQREFRIIKICLDLPRATLYGRINKRVDDMIKQGLVAEARSLFGFKQLNALQTVGYRELFDYFEGKHSLDRAVELIRQNTRRYAKRQLTWFKKDNDFIILPPGDIRSIIDLVV